MSEKDFSPILNAFDVDPTSNVKPFGSGLINRTYLVESTPAYILQALNTEVFKKPENIAQNLNICSKFLEQEHPTYPFIAPILTSNQQSYFIGEETYWRLTPFVPNSISFNQLNSPKKAYEAAKAVGAFARVTHKLNASQLSETIPHFHDLSFRYGQFENALENGNFDRIKREQSLIDQIISLKHICETFEVIKANGAIPLRVQHHDTKINNILFDKTTERSICLCDLDTVMPGYFISDLGDMMRTYLSAANEEETDFTKVKVRPQYYEAVMEGYLSQTESILNTQEKKYLHYAGQFMIYMQALRFFTDYLNDDVYYNTTYPTHNLNRTLNQMQLLESYG